MFWIIGADGREYGPVTAEEVHGWITERRANALTRVRCTPDAEWVNLETLEEFAPALKRVSPPPAGPPPASPPPPLPPLLSSAGSSGPWTPPAPRTIGEPPQVADLFHRAMGLWEEHFRLMICATGLVALLDAALGWIPLVGWLVSLLLFGPLWGGLWHCYLRLIRGEAVQVTDVFYGFGPDFKPLLLAGLIPILLIIVGLFFLVIPGIYLMVAWTFVLPLTIDRRLDWRSAMKLSRQIVHPHWVAYFLLTLVFLLLMLGGLLIFIVGVAVTLSLGMAMLAYAYEDAVATTPALADRSEAGPSSPKAGAPG